LDKGAAGCCCCCCKDGRGERGQERGGRGGLAECAGALCALWAACYVAVLVGGADGGSGAAEAGCVQGGAGVVVCGACIAVLSLEEVDILGVRGVVLGCWDGELEWSEDVGRCKRSEGREKQWSEDWAHCGGLI
jgi:hypothetical protein